ncbi:MAG: HAMP domain-containing protein [Lachnospiraceae bacterium]|nr:HAMP domain-containing protein [Lachnospiraceae bacterium]
MKRLSLQWRLTLMAAALVAAACLLLNLFISSSAIMRINEIETYMIEVAPNGQDAFMFDVASLYPDLQAQIHKSTEAFSIQSILITLAVILLAGVFTYFLAGRALAPLREFSGHMEKIQAQNLSEPLEIPHTDDEIAQLTRSFNRMLTRLDSAFMVQRQFSANAAHELRTPLAVMRTKLDVLKKQENPSAEEYAETLQKVSEQTERLSHLVKMLLEMTELETAPRNDHVCLSALIEEVLCDLAQAADEKKVTLCQHPGDAEVTGSDLLLYRAVYNAVKYNRPNGSVTVGARMENGCAVLCVEDTGIGIAAENRMDIFEPFVRVDKSRSRAMGGAGLGLALVRDIAEMHGGSVQVVKSSDKGTVIEMKLPALS